MSKARARCRKDFCGRPIRERIPPPGAPRDTSVPTRYAEERVEGLGLRARERRAAGDLDGAIATMRAAIERRLVLSGRVNRETAVLYNSFGIILTAAHRLGEALDAYRE